MSVMEAKPQNLMGVKLEIHKFSLSVSEEDCIPSGTNSPPPAPSIFTLNPQLSQE